ncbi:MAG TPA: 16S rRNA (uracil(1498)-N(3))-methyltransferase [Candidatus Baltobacteraceae bacterium]|nr:16S rRNA (uracil(1498)-N(3))-methyltransferase [Candidatus Baltobacteraceae bacterium]
MAGTDARKLSVVLRKRVGEAVEVCDSAGSAFAGTLVALDAARATVRLDEVVAAARGVGLEITLAQAVPKGTKMDFVVEKATELGVRRIVPVVTERTLGAAERAGKTERWRRLARSAAAQCGRRDVPGVDAPIAWEALGAYAREAELALLPWELAAPLPLRDALPGLLSGIRRVLVAIGPEGGFSHDEVDEARSWGARPISFGTRILRTETAGLVACSVLLYAAGEL